MMFCLLVLINCKDPIDLRGEGSIGILVVDGKVSTLPGPYTLRLGYTVGIDQKPSPVSFAMATLIDDGTGDMESFIETTKPGIYEVAGNVIQGTAGHTYHVEITLQNGRTYASKPERIPDAAAIDAPYFEFGKKSDFVGEIEVKTDVINIYTDTQFPSVEKDYNFRWDVTETYMFEQSPQFDPFTGTIPKPCYVDGITDPQRISLFTTKNQRLPSLKGTLIAQRKIDYSFLARHYFSIYVSSITTESYTYWARINELINRSGSIFDTPPAPIIGNAYSTIDSEEKVFGYFEASNTNLVRIFTLRGDVPITLKDYCNDPVYGPYYPFYPNECYACTLLTNSSKTPPSWWPQ